jgi:hypothetical protein
MKSHDNALNHALLDQNNSTSFDHWINTLHPETMIKMIEDEWEVPK